MIILFYSECPSYLGVLNVASKMIFTVKLTAKVEAVPVGSEIVIYTPGTLETPVVVCL